MKISRLRQYLGRKVRRSPRKILHSYDEETEPITSNGFC